MAPCLRKFYINELKVPNFRPFFSLNDFWVMQGSNPLALNLKKIAFGDLKIQSKFLSMILGFACPFPNKILHLIFVR